MCISKKKFLLLQSVHIVLLSFGVKVNMQRLVFRVSTKGSEYTSSTKGIGWIIDQTYFSQCAKFDFALTQSFYWDSWWHDLWQMIDTTTFLLIMIIFQRAIQGWVETGISRDKTVQDRDKILKFQMRQNQDRYFAVKIARDFKILKILDMRQVKTFDFSKILVKNFINKN